MIQIEILKHNWKLYRGARPPDSLNHLDMDEETYAAASIDVQWWYENNRPERLSQWMDILGMIAAKYDMELERMRVDLPVAMEWKCISMAMFTENQYEHVMNLFGDDVTETLQELPAII